MRRYTWLFVVGAALVVGMNPAIAAAQQDTVTHDWTKNLVFDITTTQAAYSDSWQGGEAGSFNWLTNLNGFAEKHFSPRIHFRTVLKLSFGETSTQDEATGVWSVPKKTTDKIDWENVGLLAADKPIDPFVSVRLESRFYDATNAQKFLYLSPLKLKESAGIAHRLHDADDDFVEVRLGVAFQQEIIRSIIDSLSPPNTSEYTTSRSTRSSMGVDLVSDARLQLHDNIGYVGKLTLFKAASLSDKDVLAGTPNENDWKALDVDFENVFTASITGLIKLNLHLEFKYDKEVSRSIQIRETIALGIAINLAG
jgi:hypothetical protein